MLLRITLLGLLLIAAAAVEGAWLSRLPLPAAPDLLLLIVVAAGVRRGLEAGALMGAAAGYIHDLMAGSPVGMYALSYLVVGVAAGSVMSVVDFSHRLAPALLAIAATVVLHLLAGFLVAAAGLAGAPWVGFLPTVTAAAAVNAVLARSVDGLFCLVQRLGWRPYPEKAIGYRILR